MAYSVEYADQAKENLRSILLDNPHWNARNRADYAIEIDLKIQSLDQMPERFVEVMIGNRSYRKMSHKAHAIYYRVENQEMKVMIVAILSHRQLPSVHLS